MKKIKDIANIVVFVGLIFALSFSFIITKDKDISTSERRKLAKLPSFSMTELLSGNLTKDFESYMMDQFPIREALRKTNYLIRSKVMGQNDVDGLYEYNNIIFKINYPTDEKQVQFAINKIWEIKEKYLSENNTIYISLIPDKAYYSYDDMLKIDHGKIAKIIKSEINFATYIPLENVLSLEDYYTTDLHWKQENLQGIANQLLSYMEKKGSVNVSNYSKNTFSDFLGAYSAQSALFTKEALTYLTNETTESCLVTELTEEKTIAIYDTQSLGSLDSYNVFLYGPKAVISIVNPSYQGDDRLIIFRDSFASSLAPLLVENYKEIILVDLRYITADSLASYIDFTNADILFLYSDAIINSASVLK